MKPSRIMRVRHWLTLGARGASVAVSAIATGIVVITAMFWLSGLRPVVITSGSMAPAVPVGSVIVGRSIDAAEAVSGDIVTVRLSATRQITHRVIATSRDGNLTRLHLKGDANTNSDVPVSANKVMRNEAILPWVGHAPMAVRQPGPLTLVGLLLGVLLLRAGSVWRYRVNAVGGSRHRSKTQGTLGEELRTPLTSIVGFSELLEDGALGRLSNEQLHTIRLVKRNAHRLTGLISEVP